MIFESSIKRAEMIHNWRIWVERIARVARSILGEASIYVIGSIVRGDYCGGSDIDVLIVSPNTPESHRGRAEIKALIEEEAGLPYYHPFQIHLVKPDESVIYLRRAGKYYLEIL